jgi:hypothetical protein
MRMEADYRATVIAIRMQRGSEKVFGTSGKFGHHFELPPKSVGEISQFEKELGVELPPEYAQFLMEAVVQALTWTVLPIKGAERSQCIESKPPAEMQGREPEFGFPFL